MTEINRGGPDPGDGNLYPPEWIPADMPECLSELDPASPEFLDAWAPSPAQAALVAELALRYTDTDPDFNLAFMEFCRDRCRDRDWPATMLALLEMLRMTGLGSQCMDLTVARLSGDVAVARGDVLESL
jgi:hypothetical protein